MEPFQNQKKLTRCFLHGTCVILLSFLRLTKPVALRLSKVQLWVKVSLDLWKDLRQRYCEEDVFRIANLEEELFSIKQGDMSVTANFTKLKSLWEELDYLKHIPSYACGENCNCGLGVVRGYKRNSYVVRFLRGLNEQHSFVRSQVIKPLLDINETFSLLTQQERDMQSSMSESRILLNTTNQNGSGNLAPSGRARGRGG